MAAEGTFLGGNLLFQYNLKDIVLYVMQVLYFILLTYYTGTTLGKRVLNLRVICADGNEKPGLITVIYRETIGRFLSGILCCIGYLMIVVDKENRGIHDWLCDTRVVYAKKVKVYETKVVRQVFPSAMPSSAPSSAQNTGGYQMAEPVLSNYTTQNNDIEKQKDHNTSENQEDIERDS